ncbi:hypothetical protein FRX31_034115 [Thalictrum thalictroides]|uniref:Uncharacterized protein n=1 Tax=Thalictrum thalictroides TaxID=46969 RepID=A0A7J6UUZ2_THATH|nr:hypothetical protein FRX31_034115 [Thalictrum thalictroides]
MAVLNANTVVQEVTELPDFPRYSFDFIKLNTLAQHNNNDFLNDVIGIFVGCSEVQTVRNNKIIREIWLQDETDTNVRVVLWGDMANSFAKPTDLSDKPIFVLSSTSIDFYTGTNKYTVNSRPSSNYYFDLDIPEARFLKNRIVIRLSIQDSIGSCIVSLFGNLAVEMLDKQLQEILELEQIGVRIDDLFDEAKMKEFIFQIKMTTYQDKLSLSMTKLQVVQDILEANGGSDMMENNTKSPKILELVTVKQEKLDVDVKFQNPPKKFTKV